MNGSFDIGVGLEDEVMDEICFRIPAADLWLLRSITPNWRHRIRNGDVIFAHYLSSKSYN